MTTSKFDANYLSPDTNGKSANLVGSLAQTYNVGDQLVLYYNSQANGVVSFIGQDGTLDNILDVAIAIVNVKEVDGSTIKTSQANFSNELCSIYKFIFKNQADNNILNVGSVRISSENNVLIYSLVPWTTGQSRYYCPVDINSSSALSTVYASLHFEADADDKINFIVIDSNDSGVWSMYFSAAN